MANPTISLRGRIAELDSEADMLAEKCHRLLQTFFLDGARSIDLALEEPDLLPVDRDNLRAAQRVLRELGGER